MSQARTVVLDNEAVQALLNPRHRKHRRVLARVEVVAARSLREAGAVRLVVPTAVRVEAGWDRRAPRPAEINRLRAKDVSLDTEAANVAARVRGALQVSVPDAHIAAAVSATVGPHAVLTSDVDDVRRIAGFLQQTVQTVRV